MGSASQPFLRATRARPSRGRAGIALPSALLGLVFMSVLSLAVWTMVDQGAKSGRSRQQAARAMHVAEAGMAHALGLGRGALSSHSLTRILRGSDNVAGTADDGRLIGYGLPSSDQIPIAGHAFAGGSYSVTVTDDPADTDGNALVDSNNQVRVRCVGTLPDGSSADVSAVVRKIQLPGVVINGNLEISGKLASTGTCGGIHANGNMTGGGQPTVSTLASATGTVSVTVSPKQSGAAPVAVPDLSPATYCVGADFYITAATWKPNASTLAPGTYCVTGNVEFDGDIATAASPRTVSVIASGTIKVPGKVFLRADHPDGILFLAGGDMDIQGDGGGQGLIYAGGQCYISAKPVYNGQLVCANKSPHPGANLVPANLISGDAVFSYSCTGMFGQNWRIVAWYSNLGS